MPRRCKQLCEGWRSLVLGLTMVLALTFWPRGDGAFAGQLQSDDFDALYAESIEQESIEPGRTEQESRADNIIATDEAPRHEPALEDGVDLNLDSVIAAQAPAGDTTAQHPPPYLKPTSELDADSDSKDWTWRVVPLLPEAHSDEEMTLLQELTPMGLGVVRSF